MITTWSTRRNLESIHQNEHDASVSPYIWRREKSSTWKRSFPRSARPG